MKKEAVFASEFEQMEMFNFPFSEKEIAVKELAEKIALEAPTLKELTPEQLEQVAKIVIAQRLTDELNQKVNFAKINQQKEKEVFLQKYKSHHSKRTYKNALDKLFAFCRNFNIELLALTPAQADNFIYELSNKSSSSVARLGASVASSFYSFLERRHSGIKNPFRGSKARPSERKVRNFEIPTKPELDIIINELPKLYANAVSIMANTGLRVGALPTLKKVAGNRYTAESKGKFFSLELPKDFETEIEALQGKTAGTLESVLHYHINRLHQEGKINGKYSPHDFRHFFAVNLYQKTKDIYKLKTALNHSSISTTERYLRGLGQI